MPPVVTLSSYYLLTGSLVP